MVEKQTLASGDCVYVRLPVNGIMVMAAHQHIAEEVAPMINIKSTNSGLITVNFLHMVTLTCILFFYCHHWFHYKISCNVSKWQEHCHSLTCILHHTPRRMGAELDGTSPTSSLEIEYI